MDLVSAEGGFISKDLLFNIPNPIPRVISVEENEKFEYVRSMIEKEIK